MDITDPDAGESHTGSICDEPDHGTSSVSVVGGQLCVTYEPEDDFNGMDSICVKVCDASGACDSVVVLITVEAVNDAPDATDDNVNGSQDTPMIVDVQDNDTDIDGDDLTTTIIGTSTQGVTPVVEDGDSISYTPPSGFVGLDTITYQVCDIPIAIGSTLCDTAIVIVNVGNVNDEPELEEPPVTIIPEDTTTVTICMDITDPDAGESHTGSICDEPDHGTSSVSVVGGQLCVTYEPEDDFNGMDSICVKVCDASGACDSVTVLITVEAVNDAPEAGDDTQNSLQDEVVVIDVQDNDTDIDGDDLTTTIIGTSTQGVTPVVEDGDSISYTPPSGFVGLDTITYEICDIPIAIGTTLCDTAIVVVNVGNVNDEPEIEEPPVTVIPEDTTTVTICMDITDPDAGESHTGSICDEPDHGTSSVSVVGGQLCVTYEPEDDFNGMDSICVKVCDASGACDSVVVLITVEAVNDAPEAEDDTQNSLQDEVVVIDVQDNDTDIDGDDLTTTIIGTSTQGVTPVVEDGDSISYTPPSGFVGLDTITYQVCDSGSPSLCDTAIVVVNVGNVNDEPELEEPPVTVIPEDTTTVTICMDITDPDAGESHTGSICDEPDHGTSSVSVVGGQLCVTYEPEDDFNGMDSICVKVCDASGACDSVTVLITVEAVNDAPEAEDDTQNSLQDEVVVIDVQDNDTDIDGDDLTTTIIGTSTQGVTPVVEDGDSISYTPPSGFVGLDTITYQVCDSGSPSLCDTAIVIVNVGNVNDEPELEEPPVTVIPEDTTTVTICMDITDPDAGESHTGSICDEPDHGTSSVSVVGGQLCVTYEPEDDFNGMDSICVKVCDASGACDSVTVLITVEAANDAPEAEDDTQNSLQDEVVVIDVQDNDTDIDGDDLTTTIIGTSTQGVTPVVEDGDSISYTPPSGFVGLDTITYQVCDIGGPSLCDTAIVIVNVGNVNDEPELEEPPVTAIPEDTTTVTICMDITDPDEGESHTGSICDEPDHGTASVSVVGGQLCVTYEPEDDFNGMDSICVKVCDASGACDSVVVLITVEAVNDAPEAEDDTQNSLQDEEVVIDVQDNDTDIDGDDLTTTIIGTSTQGVTPVVEDGDSISYIPPSGFVGLDTITYEVCDTGTPSLCDTAMVVVNVGNVNDEPELEEPPVTVIPEDTTTVTICMDITDPDAGESHTGSICDEPDHGTSSVNVVGGQLCVTYEPEDDFNGMDSICVKVCDASGACDSIVVLIEVIPRPDTVCVDLDVKVFLEGSLISDDGTNIYGSEMRTTLNELRLLPGQSYADGFFSDVNYNSEGLIYQYQPWLFSDDALDEYDSQGDPNNGDADYPESVVDWVLITLRKEAVDEEASVICQHAALLHKDGTVEIPGTNCCKVLEGESYYVTIEHHSHLIVMSDAKVVAEEGGALTYDFTTQQSYRAIDPGFGSFIGEGQKEVAPGVWAMMAGNGEQKFNANDTDLNVDDEVIWVIENGKISAYDAVDYNMNGDVNYNDRILWEQNNGLFTSVPRDKNQ